MAGISIEGHRSSTSAGVLDEMLLRSACRKKIWRLVVILAVAYVVNYLDRNGVGYAALTMNRDLGLTAKQFGWGAGIAVISYSLLEVPSNLLMHKVGARRWLSRIILVISTVLAASLRLVVGKG